MMRRLQLLIAVIIWLLLVSGCTSEPEVTATRLMETAASDENFDAEETVARFDQYCTEHRNVRRATTISGLSETQIDFVNSHFDAVITSVLDDQVREQIQGPMLLLYRSIQGTWEEYKQFDWTHIEANENMFLHNSNSAHPNNRILTIWNSWLMDGNDLVDRNAPDAMNHWINYYTVTASEQVYSHDYDGLFIDSAGHKIGAGAVHRLMPDGYSDNDWRDGRYAALEFVKSYFPDKFVVFNGLHSGNGVEASLALTDGGLWETFAFRPSDSTYKGEDEWKEVIELMERNKQDKLIHLTAKKDHLTSDIQSRMFVLVSYLLVSDQNVSLNMIDLDHDEWGTIQYYPEYEICLGPHLDAFSVNAEGIYMREFEGGIILANPSASISNTFILDDKYGKVFPVGGGVVEKDGSYDGFLDYETVDNEIILPPITGVVLLRTTSQAVCGNGTCEEGETPENCPEDCLKTGIEGNPFGVAFGEGSSNPDYFMSHIYDLGVRRTKVSFFCSRLAPKPGV